MRDAAPPEAGGRPDVGVDAAVDASPPDTPVADAAADKAGPDVVRLPPAPAANVEFNMLYDGIIKVRCSPCHVIMMPRAGMLDMGDAPTALASLSMGSTGCATAMPKERVVPGKPDDSYVIKKLTGATEICGERMPFKCIDAPPDGGAEPDAAVVPDAALDAEADAADAAAPDAGKADVRDSRAPEAAIPDAAPDLSPDGPPLTCLPADSIKSIRAWIASGAKIGGVVVADGTYAPSWSIQPSFQVGMMGGAHPWTDYPNSYVVSVEPPAMGLIAKSWIKVSAQSKNYTGGPQATITLTAPADVYLVVDDRWGQSPPWLAGWPDTGWNLTIFESNTRPALNFSLYKKSAPAGEVPLPPIGANNAYDFFIIVD